MPALAVYPTADPVADWPLIALIVGSHKHLPYLTVKAVHGAHWVHIENPSEVNRALEDWLKALDVKSLEAQIGEKKKEIARLKEELTAAKKVQKLAKKGEL
jgi:soluble epoxide hydrolase/lipid-phosphate phosphatase